MTDQGKPEQLSILPNLPSKSAIIKHHGKFRSRKMEDNKTNWSPDLYKKFFKTKSAGGFLALRGWLEVGKVSVDIGEVAVNGGLVSNTVVWAPAISLAAYLKAVANNTAERLYPADPRKKLDLPESFIYYGGSITENGPVSRIIKVSHWHESGGKAFEWKAGHFRASATESGAFVPDLTKEISLNRIKIERSEMAEMSYMIDLALQALTNNEMWLTCLAGKAQR